MFEIATIIAGIGAGITYSLTSWGKKEGQAFDSTKFATTVAIGAMAGIGMSLTNISIDLTYQYLLNLGIVPLVENVVKIIKRKIISR